MKVKTMMIKGLLLRWHQQSIIDDERAEEVVIYEVEVTIDGVVTSGHVVGYFEFVKRDMEDKWFAAPEVAEVIDDFKDLRLIFIWNAHSLKPKFDSGNKATREIEGAATEELK